MRLFYSYRRETTWTKRSALRRLALTASARTVAAALSRHQRQ
jgi:hypothetical protein